MSELIVRRLLVDLDTPLPRHWNGGDAFRTALFNALSFSFPAGEQFFIDAIKRALAEASPELQARFDAEARGFIGQEATHRRIHQRFNALLEQQGLLNHWDGRIRRRQAHIEQADARVWLGFTAATEHFTAVLADYLFSHPEALAGAEPRLRDLWLWHASEESEHRSTAFDLYRACDGDEIWRRRLFWMISLSFATDLMRQVAHNLWRDGSWWWPSTWHSAWRMLFAKGGLVRECVGPWSRYLAADFHPSQGDAQAALLWLAANGDLAPPVVAQPAP